MNKIWSEIRVSCWPRSLMEFVSATNDIGRPVVRHLRERSSATNHSASRAKSEEQVLKVNRAGYRPPHLDHKSVNVEAAA
jgi:hypothetical protein